MTDRPSWCQDPTCTPDVNSPGVQIGGPGDSAWCIGRVPEPLVTERHGVEHRNDGHVCFRSPVRGVVMLETNEVATWSYWRGWRCVRSWRVVAGRLTGAGSPAWSGRSATMADTPSPGSATDLAEIYRIATEEMSYYVHDAESGNEDALHRAAQWATIALAADRRGRG